MDAGAFLGMDSLHRPAAHSRWWIKHECMCLCKKDSRHQCRCSLAICTIVSGHAHVELLCFSACWGTWSLGTLKDRVQKVGGGIDVCVCDEWTVKPLVFSHQEHHWWGLQRINTKNKMWSNSLDGWWKIEQMNTDSDIQQSVTMTGLWSPVLASLC